MSIHWGSFIIGAVAAVVVGGGIAIIIGVFNGGGSDIFD